MTFRQIHFDGCNGWKLGSIVEAKVASQIMLPSEDEDDPARLFTSRNQDGLFEDESGETLLIPLE